MSIKKALECNECGVVAETANIYAEKGWITLDGELIKGSGVRDPKGDGYLYNHIQSDGEPQHFCSTKCLLQSLDGE